MGSNVWIRYGYDYIRSLSASDPKPIRGSLIKNFCGLDGGWRFNGPWAVQSSNPLKAFFFCALLKPSTRFTLKKPPSPADARFAVAGKVIIGVRPWGICSCHWIKPRRFDSKLPFGLSRTRLPIPRRSSLWPTPFPSATKTAFSSTLRRFLSFPFFILFYFVFSSPEYLPIGKILFFALWWSVCVERPYFMPRSSF